MWKNKKPGVKTKMSLYEALVFSALLYGADTWNMECLDAVYHKRQCRILGVTQRRDRMENWNGNAGSHPQEDTATVFGACTVNGQQMNTMSYTATMAKDYLEDLGNLGVIHSWRTSRIYRVHQKSRFALKHYI